MNLKLAMSAAVMMLSYVAPVPAAQDFQQWLLQQSDAVQSKKIEFQEYRDKRDKAFTDFLKAQWKAVDVVKGKVLDEAPKPVLMPVAPPAPPPAPEPEPDVAKGAAKSPAPVSIVLPEATKAPLPEPVISQPIVSKGVPLSIDFYGRVILFHYDARLKHPLARRIDKDAISDYWSVLGRADYDTLLQQLQRQKQSLQLNDWAYAAMINKLAIKVNRGRRNEASLLSWFLLAKSGYRARIAYNDVDIFLLVPSQQELFEVSYFTFAGKRYYAIAFDGARQKPGRVYTYDGEYPDTSLEFDMRVTPVVAADEQIGRRHLSFSFEGKKYNVEAVYDRGRIQFFDSYPQLDLALYFSSGVYPATATPLQKQLAGYMQGMSEIQAVNFLLRFVQTSLKYETDEQQFGRENYLFPEETLFYPYSDCEDRAVLFAWLVNSLLKLEVVGLDYPGHVATAVRLGDDARGDSVVFEGKRYVVTDPTYINARAGMSMPKFSQYKPSIISY